MPNENPYLTNYPLVRSDLMKLAGHENMGSNTDEFLAVMTDIANLTQAQGKQIWALAGINGKTQFVVGWMFKAGTTWQVDSSGKVINVLQTDAFAQVMDFENKLWKAGAIHPDGVGDTIPDIFIPGQIAMTVDSFSGFFGDPIISKVKASTPGAEVEFFVPPAVDGGDLVIQRDDGYWGIVAISAEAAKDSKKLDELLGILNYWRAPFGSQENLFITTGIEGVNYKFGDSHEIIPLKDERADSDRLALQWLGCFASPTFSIPVELKQYTDNVTTTIEKLISRTVPNPVAGNTAPSAAKLGTKLDQLNKDYRNGCALGGVTDALRERGVPAAVTTDGPSGLRLSAYASLLPCGTALACAWDPDAVRELAALHGAEMIRKGSDILLSPGMNIHRNPLCGRNFEYFSEDPLVAGTTAVAVVTGIQSQGVSACPKHFAANNQETNRTRADSRVSERALREIYLRGFE